MSSEALPRGVWLVAGDGEDSVAGCEAVRAALGAAPHPPPPAAQPQAEIRKIADKVDNALALLVVCPSERPVAAADLRKLRGMAPYAFMAVVLCDAQPTAGPPALRERLMDDGLANMVTHVAAAGTALATALGQAAAQMVAGGDVACPVCRLPSLTTETLWTHLPLYHINAPRIAAKCPACPPDKRPSGNLQPHYHDHHRPATAPAEPADPTLAWVSFALVMCQRESDGRFLLVQEFGQEGFWCPGGHVDGAETFAAAAVRETKEEAGVDVELKGILCFENFPNGYAGYVRQRVIFFARPRDESQLPKTIPDFESSGAAWASADEIASHAFALRGSEPLKWSRYIADGGTIHPLSILKER